MSGRQGTSAAADGADASAAGAGPIAVVGLGCRFPGGASGVEAFWDLLVSGREAVVEVPAERWSPEEYHDPDPDAPGRMYSRFGAFVDGVWEFDAALFGIPSAEAAEMDPQQRFVLEVAWEALEHAGIAPDSLRGSRTGVFVGMSGSDFDRMHLAGGDLREFGGYTATGGALNMAANRLSYLLGLEGPSLVVDTACSSSLVALHLACQSLRTGECDTALVAGVNLMLSPRSTVALSKGRFLAPDGRCKTFDASADGYGRGEGCGVVVLRTAEAARSAGQRVLALVRGTATNQDGRSNGLTAPRGGAQEDVVRRALAAAGVRPAEVGYVETHGTGTALGDPIEVRALAAVLGEGRDRSRPVALGAVKTNIGHLEAGAGIAGFIKAVLTVERGTIPPHPHLERLNPFIPWDDLPVTVPTEPTPWPDERRVAGVSSFGFGGTNAHAVVESAPPPEPVEPDAAPAGPVLVKVTGRDEEALRAGAARLAAHVADAADTDLRTIAWTAGTGRADLPARAALVAEDVDELRAGLTAVAEGRARDGVTTGRVAAAGTPRVGFAIPGQGPRLAGALAGVYGRVPAVTEVVDEVADVIGSIDDLPLSVLLHDTEEAAEALKDTAVSMPALFTVAVALGRWWADVGVRPDVVLGHSGGAYAAAVLAGVWSLRDGARLAAARGRLMGGLPPVGAMAAVFGSAERLDEHPALRSGEVVIASYNGPRETVISGPTEAVLAVMDDLAEQGVKSARLRVSYASHSPLMDPVLGPLREAFDGVEMRPPTTEFVSDTTGETAGDEIATVDYWVRHTRLPVRFAAAMRTMLDRRVKVVIELGPGGLLPLFMSVAGERPPVCVPSVVTEVGAARGLLEAAGRVWASGAELDWSRVNGPAPAARAVLPTYPFQRRTYRPALNVDAAPPPEPAARDAEPRPAETPEPVPTPDDPPREAPAGHPGSDAERVRDITSYLRRRLAEALEPADPADLDEDTGLFDLGLTSAIVVKLRGGFERDLGTRVPTTAVFEHPTIRSLARYLADMNATVPKPQASAADAAEAGDGAGTAGRPEPVAVGRSVDSAPAPAETAGETAKDGRGGDAIAIVGMACRFPGGANDLDGFWKLLREGRDATGELPPERLRLGGFDAAQRGFRGGFLDVPVDAFDPEAFGISPREARTMDPQQRLLLEVTWEALEDAGCPVDELADSATGVFLGMTTTDYLQLLTLSGTVGTDPYAATGTAFSAAAGRLSYFLGAQGPCLAVDTACSSSLVAVHLAVRSLRSGESDRAIVAGVNLILSPTTTAGLVNLGALSPDGRCKTFDASADGYARGEGAGALILKRLDDALADGDRVWAVIRGSAVNQDGRSAGLTVPNGRAQRAVIRAALRDAGVRPDAVGYVEAHGTGTALGDPVEIDALAEALHADGRGGRRDAPLLVGSVKTNVGHLEAAAGAAGLIKTVLALRHGTIPPHLHLSEPNPLIDWDGLDIRIPTDPTEWPTRDGGRRVAGVSSFGFGGTNAHVVLEEAPAPDEPERPASPDERRPALLVLSARTDGALKAAAEAYGGLLAADGAPALADVARGAALHRTHLPVRMAVTAETAGETADALAAAARGERPAGVVTGRAVPADRRRVVFAFSGQGSQWAGMGAGLLRDPVCADVLRRCDAIVRRLAGWSLLDELVADRASSRLADTAVAQPAIVAVQAALVERWRTWGVRPDAVVGHSVGEISAAHAAGVLDLDQAVRIAVRRGEVMAATRGSGAMAAVNLPPDEAAELIAPYGDRLSIAAVNGPDSTVLAGDVAALDEVEPRVRERGARWARIQDEYAFHTNRMAVVHDDLLDALSDVAPAEQRVPVFSTVTGRRADPDAFGPDYWAANMVEPVRFHDAVRAAAVPDAHMILLEIGPHAVLGAGAARSLDGLVAATTTIASMRSRRDAVRTLLEAAGRLYALGHDIDHRALQPERGRRVRLPGYQWQRQRYWMPTSANGTGVRPAAPSLNGVSAPGAASTANGVNGSGGGDGVEDELARHAYEIDWQPVDRPGGPGGAADDDGVEADSALWVLLGDRGGVAAAVAERLADAGHRTLLVPAETIAPDTADPFGGPLPQDERVHAVLHFGTLDAGPEAREPGTGLDEALAVSCGPALAATRTFAALPDRHAPKPRLWVVTRGGAAVDGSPVEPAHAPVWGLGRVIALEEPELWGGLIDLDPAVGDPAADARAVLAEVLHPDGEDQVAYRSGTRLAARLRRTGIPAAGSAARIDGDAAYLITGGRGSLGLRVADRLAAEGARHLILTGRRPLPEDGSDAASAAIRRLRERGVTVHTPAVDVADAKAMARLLRPDGDAPWPAVRGVVHAAGTFEAATVREMSWERFRSVLRPKVEGTLVLDALTRDADLDFFVVFSSASAVWGSASAGHYAAGNCFADLMAHDRGRRGLPGLSIDWGWWEGSDLVAEEHLRHFASIGLAPVTDALGLAALDRLLASERRQVTVAPVDWSRYRPMLEARRRRPLLALMAAEPAGASASAGDAALLAALRRAPSRQARARLLEERVQREVAAVLGLPADAPPMERDRGFFDAGMDSIMSVEVRDRLQDALGVDLPPTAAFENPTVASLTEFLLARLDDLTGPAEPAGAGEAAGPAAAGDESELDGLSEEELLELLGEELEQR